MRNFCFQPLNVGLGQPTDIKSLSGAFDRFKVPGRKELIVRARKITGAHQAVRSKFFLYKGKKKKKKRD